MFAAAWIGVGVAMLAFGYFTMPSGAAAEEAKSRDGFSGWMSRKNSYTSWARIAGGAVIVVKSVALLL